MNAFDHLPHLKMAEPVTPPTFPLRPVNGGPFDKAPAKHGQWFYEPKYNGWRAMIHAPTGQMFNRQNEPLTIQYEFPQALAALKELWLSSGFVWLDCEVLERRHTVARGCLIVLDCPDQNMRKLSYVERRRKLEERLVETLVCVDGLKSCWSTTPETVVSHNLPDGLLFPRVSLVPQVDGTLATWSVLQEINKQLKADFYEGLVAKRGDSTYPCQLRSAKDEYPYWQKHRWAY
jgi:ATP-dependent DNA ligase